MLFEELPEINDKLIYIGDKPEDYKDAIVGLSHDDNHLIYSYTKLMHSMVVKNGWTEEEAAEWIDYNTIRNLGYQGEYAPIVMFDIED